MPRMAKKIECDKNELRSLRKIIGSHTAKKRLVERATIILKSHDGLRIDQIARDMGTRPR